MKEKFIFASILISLFCSFVTVVFAQTTSAESISSINQVQVLEKQVDLLNQINNKILNTVYWALGGLITVFLAIVGLNFFQNFSLNKRKIDSLKEETNNRLNEALSKLQEQNKINAAALNTKVEAKVKFEVKNSLENFETKISQLMEDYEDINRENLIRKAFEHKEKRQVGYIMCLIEVLELDIKKGWDYRINESLGYISECLDERRGDSNNYTDIQRLLEKLPKEHGVQKNNIEAKMKL